MLNRPKKITDYSPIISAVIEKLTDGQHRLAVSEYPLGHACLANYRGPDLEDLVSSSKGISGMHEEIEKDFYEEMTLIEKVLEEYDMKPELAKGQPKDATDKLMKVMHLRALSLKLWNWYAIPWRYKRGLVHFIWPPADATTTPTIHSFTVPDFLSMHARIDEERLKEVAKLTTKSKIWNWIGVIALIVIGLYILSVVL